MKKNGKDPFILGITGSIGSGKSAVGRYLTELGITVIDTDILVHQLLANDWATKKAIVEQFGLEVLENNVGADEDAPWTRHAIDRKKLGQIVFASPDARRKLEQIVHPNTILALRHQIDDLRGQPIVAVLVPLLFESKLQDEYDEIWTVFTSEETLKERLRKRDNLSDQEIENRLAAQLPQIDKIKAADQTIDNSQSPEETKRQVKLLVEKILPTNANH